MSEQLIQRVRHRELLPIRAADLTAEQRYHIGMRRRHLQGVHGWGIVQGLELSRTEQGHLQIASGLAVDGYGRLLDVPQNWLVERDVLDRAPFHGRAVDAWLIYARIPESPPLLERQVHRPGEHRRWRELAHIRLTAAGEKLPDPYAPPFAGDPCHPYGPHLEPADDPAEEWPVYLGRVLVKDSLTIDQEAKRPYVSLRAARISPPTAQVQLQVGGHSASDKRRFTLSLPGQEEGAWQEQLTLDASGAASFKTNTTISPQQNEAHIVPLVETNKLAFKAMPAIPETPSPWAIYRVQYKEAGRTVNEIRCEIDLPPDDPNPAQYQFQIGAWEDGAFRSKLIVRADGTVTINGDLDGIVSRSPIQPDLDEPEFVGALVDESHKAMLYSAAKLDPSIAGLLEIIFDVQEFVFPGTSVSIGGVIANSGQSLVTGITLYVRTTHNDNQIDYQVIDSGFNLQPRGVNEYLSSVPIPATIAIGETINVEVTAIGKGPMFNIVENSFFAVVKTTVPPG